MCANIDIDVHGIQKVGELLEGGVKAAAAGTRDELLELGQDNARSIIVSRDAIWKSELYRSIKTSKHSNGVSYGGKVFSHANHAAPVEHGAQYTTRGPPVKALIPWVKSKMGGDMGDTDLPEVSSLVAFEDIEIAGDDDPDDVFVRTDLPYQKARFFEEKEWRLQDTFTNQEVVLWDYVNNEYREGVVTGYFRGIEPQVTLDDGETVVLTPSPETNFNEWDIVYGRDIDSLNEVEKLSLIQESADNLNYVKKAGNDDVEDVFKDALDDIFVGLDDEEMLDALQNTIDRIEKVSDVPDVQTSGKGYSRSVHQKETKEIWINTGRKRGSSVSTSIHEIKHSLDKTGFPVDSYDTFDDIQVGEHGYKTNEYRSKGSSTPVNFGYYSRSTFDGEPNIQNSYADAEQYFLAPSVQEAEDELSHFGDSIQREIDRGINYDYLTNADYTDVTGRFDSDNRPNVGDKLRIQADDTTHYLRVESNTDYMTVVSDMHGRIREINWDNRYLNSEKIDVVEYAEGDGAGRSFKEFLSDNPREQFYEALNRAWLRGVLASDKYDSSEYDRERHYLVRNYGLVNAHETGTTLWQLMLTDDPNINMHKMAAQIYQNHPDLFYAISQLFDPTDEFKEDFEDVYDVSYEEMVDRVTP